MSASDQLQCDVAADWSNGFSHCLYDWQGLEGAALALLAAGISVIFLQRQIDQARVHRADEIARRHNAARLTLPLALAAVSELVQAIGNEVADEFESFLPNGSRSIQEALGAESNKTTFEPKALPSEVLGSFEEFVASLDNGIDVRHVAELVASIQILLARFNGFSLNQAAPQLGLSSLLLDAAKVKLLNEKMYNYARFVDDNSFGIVGIMAPEKAWDEILGKAQGLVFHRRSPDVFFPELKARIDRYKERKESPWNEKFAA